MNIKKLDQKLEGTLADEQFEWNDASEILFTKIKQGGDLFLLTESDLSDALVLSALQKVPGSLEGSPRVLIVTAESDKAYAMFLKAKHLSRRCEIDIEHAHQNGVKIEQRNNIFEGAEIIIGTLRRVFDLYIQNGINMNLLQLLIIDDADIMLRDAKVGQMKRIIESLPRCQKIVVSTKKSPRVMELVEEMLVNAEFREVKEVHDEEE